MTYQDSQRLIFEAEAAARSGDTQRAKDLFLEAAVLQRDMIASVPEDRVRTRSVFGLSAAALFYKAGDLDASERLACELLSQSWVDPYSAFKLRELLKAVWRARAEPGAAPLTRPPEQAGKPKPRYSLRSLVAHQPRKWASR